MKFAILALLTLTALTASAKDVRDFNKVLVQDVQKSIQTDNDQDLKSKEAVLRGPASVEEGEEESEQAVEEENKIEKSKQLGTQKW